MKKLRNYLTDNLWVWCGTGLVLLTLSGTTLKQALWITCFTVLIHFIATVLRKGDSE